MTLSTTYAEYVALREALKEAKWLKGFVEKIIDYEVETTVFRDNQSALHLSKNQLHHERTKHIDIKFYFVRDLIKKGIVKVNKVATKMNINDFLTKVVPRAKH